MKKRFIIYLITVFLSFVLFDCSDTKNEDFELLNRWMTGSFTSEEHSKLDSNYYNIHLHMVPIWKDRKDGKWLYVEQAAFRSLERPYRQRVYRLRKIGSNKFESAVFTIPDPVRFAGEWKSDNPLSSLSPDSLKQKIGCSIVLQKVENAFIGRTVDKNCPSNLSGASHATSEVRIESNKLTSWDRGFDENGNQVWGAESGPYIFKKLNKN